MAQWTASFDCSTRSPLSLRMAPPVKGNERVRGSRAAGIGPLGGLSDPLGSSWRRTADGGFILSFTRVVLR